MDELKIKLLDNGNTYRIHQDNLRWTLLAGYAAFLVGILSLDEKPDGFVALALVMIGICYMFILAVENFFYNLFSEYVKDCEIKIIKKEMPQTIGDFTKAEANKINPFHHSFFFALIIVFYGNFIIAWDVSNSYLFWFLQIMNLISFFVIFLFWRVFVFPCIVLPLQHIFDINNSKNK